MFFRLAEKHIRESGSALLVGEFVHRDSQEWAFCRRNFAEYFLFGNVLKDEDAASWDVLNGATTYRYDPAGNVLTRTDANGATTTWTYDALNWPLTEVSARSGAPTETVSWKYDQGPFGIGRRTAMTDPSGSTTWTYERRGLVASRTQVIGGQSYVSKYTYDADGNRETQSLPSSRALTYGCTIPCLKNEKNAIIETGSFV